MSQSEANRHQVGGTHYKTSYEHWDWVLKLGVGYLEGNATKYVARWRRKGGLEDLRKALHYVNKAIESIPVLIRGGDAHEIYLETNKFASANGLTEQEADFCGLMASASATGDPGRDLRQAREIILALMDQAEGLPEARSVPVEDSNKHAVRASNPGPGNSWSDYQD